ncbi:MAG: hypothetical protein VB039_10225 [Oscillospiraceae bacterium]|nr:hypothetical protein [Oscillospiraceae bacterium]
MANSIKGAQERVDISIPRGSDREDPNLFVAINGKNYLLPRGKRSSVPPEVAREIERSERARDALDETMGELQRAGK